MTSIVRKVRVSNYIVAQKLMKDIKTELGVKVDLLDLEKLFNPYTIYANEEEPMKYSAWWRLTAPLFILMVIGLHLTYLPIHWIFTGRYGFAVNSTFGEYCDKWNERIWERR